MPVAFQKKIKAQDSRMCVNAVFVNYCFSNNSIPVIHMNTLTKSNYWIYADVEAD